MNNIDTPKYLPFIKYPALINIGASRLDNAQWIEPDGGFKRYYQNKIQQADKNKAAVYLSQEQSIDAQTELSTLLLQHLVTDHSASFKRDANRLYLAEQKLSWPLDSPTLNDQDTLWRASLWIQDDICLLQPYYTNKKLQGYKLTAASVCAPSHWLLAEKMGRDFFELHSPVPDLKIKLQSSIMRVFNQLTNKLIVRANWGITDSDTLMRLPEDQQANNNVEQESQLYLRVERQSLRKLTKTGAIVFTIRVYTHPLERIIAITGALSGLKASIQSMSAEEYSYKSMQRLEPALKKFFLDHG